MAFGTKNKCDCDELDSYRYRVEELEQQQRDADERAERERQRRERERREEREQAMYEASSWSEAFGKQAIRVRGELPIAEGNLAWATEHKDSLLPSAEADVAGLKAQLAAIERARTIYHERMAAVEEQCKRLRQEALEAIAVQVEAEKLDAMNLPEHLRSDDPSTWLYW